MMRPLLVVGVLGGLGAQSMAIPGSLGPPTAPSVSATRLQVAPDGSEADVVLHVTAGPQDLGPLAVFWIVSLPNTPRAWEEPRYIAPAQTLSSLAAGTSADLSWSAASLPLPAGRYDVTAWVHKILGPGRTEHVAGGMVGSFSIARGLPASVQLGTGWFQEPRGPLELQTVSVAQQAPQTQTVAVEATVLNRGDVPQSGRVYWIVGRYTDTQPFLAPFWQSDSLPIDGLEPGASRSLWWTRRIGLPAGTYGVSVWVHAELPSGLQHSHGSLSIPLALEPDVSHVLRHGPPASVQVASASRDGSGVLHVVLENDAATDARIWLGADLVHENRRYDWYQSLDEPQASLPQLSIHGPAQQVIEVPLDVACGPDSVLARIRLFTGPELAADALADDVLVDACP